MHRLVVLWDVKKISKSTQPLRLYASNFTVY